jgi:hypothetical protein
VVRAAKRWKASVKKHFDFLTDYGFRFDHVEDKWWATTAVYLSAALGVEVTRSVEFDRLEISLLRLVEGQAPEVEVWVTDRPLNRVLFDNVLEARGSDLLGQIPTGLSQRVVEEQLRLDAELLRTLVGDFLKGSDAALLEGERVIRERVSTNPQEVTIWLPATPRKPTKGGRERRQSVPTRQRFESSSDDTLASRKLLRGSRKDRSGKKRMPGAGLEPARPCWGTADFKSAAYSQFRHPGGARIARAAASY